MSNLIEVLVDELTEAQWETAHAIAHELFEEQSKLNHDSRSKSNSDGILTEIKKVISYLRNLNTESSLFQYLEVWVKHGKNAGHGNNLIAYYRAIDTICRKHLMKHKDEHELLLSLLGWAARLYKYYAANPKKQLPSENTSFTPKMQQARQEKVEQLLKSEKLRVGKQIEAVVIQKKKGNKVKYEINGIPYEEKEPKQFENIPDSGLVTVEIKSLKEDGSINHIKFVKS